jgi:hypothetical protein
MIRTIPGLNDPLVQAQLPTSVRLAAAVLSAYSQILAIAVDQVEYSESTPGANAMVMLLGRRIIQSLDAASVLVDVGRAEAAIVHYRSILEAKWSIDYIIDETRLSESRASAFEYFLIQDELRAFKRFYSHLIRHGHDWEYLSQDSLVDTALLASDPDNIGRVSDAIASRQSESASERFANVRTEIERLTSANILKRVRVWHQCFGDHVGDSVMHLARKVGQTFYYDYFYRRWSDLVHPGNIHSSLSQGRDGVAYLHHICHLDGVESAAATVALMTQGVITKLMSNLKLTDPKIEIRYACAKAITLRHQLEDSRPVRMTYKSSTSTTVESEHSGA